MKLLRKKEKTTLIAFVREGTTPKYAYVAEPQDSYLLQELELIELFDTPLGNEIVLYHNVYDIDALRESYIRRR